MTQKIKKQLAVLFAAVMTCLSLTACSCNCNPETPKSPDNSLNNNGGSNNNGALNGTDSNVNIDDPTVNGGFANNGGSNENESEDKNEPLYKLINYEGEEDKYGNYILFGSYPQSEITQNSVKAALNELAGALPTSSNSGNWISYNYVGYATAGDEGISYANVEMWYQDVTRDNVKYRGVYFTTERTYTQENNKYYTNMVYWFKWEPIKWKILTNESGKALLLCEMIIDSHEYQKYSKLSGERYYLTDENGNIQKDDNGNDIYANNYARSTIRAWLNDSFYSTAFSTEQKEIIRLTEVDNSEESTRDADGIRSSASKFVCENTNDYIFLLSENEVTRGQYGFANYKEKDWARRKAITAYAKVQGARPSVDADAKSGRGEWWLRSPYDIGVLSGHGGYYNGADAHVLTVDGYAAQSSGVGMMNIGVCPALWITLS